MGSEWTVAELCALRHKAVEEYIRVGDDRESWQVDLRAVAVELDRALTQPGDPASVETRAQRVATALDTPDRQPTPPLPPHRRLRTVHGRRSPPRPARRGDDRPAGAGRVVQGRRV
jgi:hypothetical protein